MNVQVFKVVNAEKLHPCLGEEQGCDLTIMLDFRCRFFVVFLLFCSQKEATFDSDQPKGKSR